MGKAEGPRVAMQPVNRGIVNLDSETITKAAERTLANHSSS